MKVMYSQYSTENDFDPCHHYHSILGMAIGTTWITMICIMITAKCMATVLKTMLTVVFSLTSLSSRKYGLYYIVRCEMALGRGVT